MDISMDIHIHGNPAIFGQFYTLCQCTAPEWTKILPI